MKQEYLKENNKRESYAQKFPVELRSSSICITEIFVSEKSDSIVTEAANAIKLKT
jgi:hypothetical protein